MNIFEIGALKIQHKISETSHIRRHPNQQRIILATVKYVGYPFHLLGSKVTTGWRRGSCEKNDLYRRLHVDIGRHTHLTTTRVPARMIERLFGEKC